MQPIRRGHLNHNLCEMSLWRQTWPPADSAFHQFCTFVPEVTGKSKSLHYPYKLLGQCYGMIYYLMYMRLNIKPEIRSVYGVTNLCHLFYYVNVKGNNIRYQVFVWGHVLVGPLCLVYVKDTFLPIILMTFFYLCLQYVLSSMFHLPVCVSKPVCGF